MTGLLFFLLPIIVISNSNASFSQSIARVIEFFSGIFSINISEGFVKGWVIAFLILAPLLTSAVFKRFNIKVELRYRHKLFLVATVYICLIIVNYIVFHFCNQEFSFMGVVASIFVAGFSLISYILSCLCDIFKRKLQGGF